MQSPCRCNKRTGRYCSSSNPVLYTAYWAENGNLGIFEHVENYGSDSAPNHCFYQKVAVGMEKEKCNRFVGATNALGFTERRITRFYTPLIGPRVEIWKFSKLSKTMIPPVHQSIFIPKGSCRYGEPKNVIALSVQQMHWVLLPVK